MESSTEPGEDARFHRQKTQSEGAWATPEKSIHWDASSAPMESNIEPGEDARFYRRKPPGGGAWATPERMAPAGAAKNVGGLRFAQAAPTVGAPTAIFIAHGNAAWSIDEADAGGV